MQLLVMSGPMLFFGILDIDGQFGRQVIATVSESLPYQLAVARGCVEQNFWDVQLTRGIV